MRRLEFLISHVRNKTNNKNTNKITQNEMGEMFNDAQNIVMNLIVSRCKNAKVFTKIYSIDVTPNSDNYDLPSDIYGVNSIFSVCFKSGSLRYPIDRVESSDASSGYNIIGGKVYLFPASNLNGKLEILYDGKPRKLGVRLGLVTAATSAVSIVTTPTDATDISKLGDFVSIVDKDGATIVNKIRINSYNVNGTISTSTPFTITAGQIAGGCYAVLGEDSTTNSDLPEVLEPILRRIVERIIFVMDSSTDEEQQVLLTKEEENDIVELFSSNIKDPIYPAITNSSYMV